MGGVYDETNAMFLAEQSHRRFIKSSFNTLSVMQRNVLLTRFSTVIVDIACLFQYLYGFAPFRCSSEYQYHASPILKRWVKCLS